MKERLDAHKSAKDRSFAEFANKFKGHPELMGLPNADGNKELSKGEIGQHVREVSEELKV